MSKLLLSSLFMLILLASPVRAGEWDLDMSGHVQGLYGYSDTAKRFKQQNSSNHGVGQADLSFSARYTFEDSDYSISANLDLMGGVDQELKDYNQGSWGEEAYMIGDSPYGRLMLGQTFNVDAQFHEGAPTAGALSNNNDVVDFIRNPNWKRRGKTTKFATLNTTYINTDGAALKASYISPEFYNTMVGFSYVPDAYNRRGLINKHASYAHDDGYIAALYNHQDFGFMQMAMNLGYGEFHHDDKEFSAGLHLSRGGWSVGGGWRKTSIDGKDPQRRKEVSESMPEFFDGYREGQAWNAGIGYEIGPYQAALTYFESKADNSEHQDKIIVLSNQYKIDKHIEIYAAAAHVDFEGNSHSNWDNNQGYAFVAGIGLNF